MTKPQSPTQNQSKCPCPCSRGGACTCPKQTCCPSNGCGCAKRS